MTTLIAEAAVATPEAVAVVTPLRPGADRDADRLTYAELERRATTRAHALRALGVASGSVVAVCVDKSTDLVVTLLAVLKAGGAYLPLDPDHPRERLGRMRCRCDGVEVGSRGAAGVDALGQV